MQRAFIKGLVLSSTCAFTVACGSDPSHHQALLDTGEPIPSDFNHVQGMIITPDESQISNCALRPESLTSVDNWPYDFQLDIALLHPDGQCLPGSTKVSYWVYGFDRYVADVSATKMGEWKQVPVHSGDYFRIGLDNAAFEQIEYQSGGSDALAYYTGFSVDLDGNGEVCNGDLAQNYDVTDFETYPFSQHYVLAVVQLKTIDYRPCES